MTITIDLPATLEALDAAASRTAALLLGVEDPTQRARGLSWTIAEVAAHLVGDVQHYTGFVTGERDARQYLGAVPEASTPVERSVVGNAMLLEEFEERDLANLAGSLPREVEHFAEACGRAADAPILTETGLHMTPSTMACALLGEQLIHGFDIARTLRVPWPIARRDALLVIDGIMAMVPSYVDPVAAATLRVAYELRFRGGGRYRMAVDHGQATVDGAGQPADCWMSFDPAAFLLVGYGRVGQMAQVLRGKMIAGGRRPWLSLKFGNLVASV